MRAAASFPIISLVRRIGLSAAGLIVVLLLALTLATTGRAGKAPVRHTCSVTDRDFIATAKTNLTAMGLWGEQYLSGDAEAADVVRQSKRAAAIVNGTSPTDPSLRSARKLMWAMFMEYGRAIQAHARKKDAGSHMFRAYGLANFAHQVLAAARPALRERGCDVTPLL